MDTITATIDFPKWVVVLFLLGFGFASIVAFIKSIKLGDAKNDLRIEENRNELLNKHIEEYGNAITLAGQIQQDAKKLGLNPEGMRIVNAIVWYLPSLYKFRSSALMQEITRNWVLATTMYTIHPDHYTHLAAYNAETRFINLVEKVTFEFMLTQLDLQAITPPDEDEQPHGQEEDDKILEPTIIGSRADLV